MASLVSTIIGEAATRLQDPSQQRITPSEWLMYYNDTLELLTRTYKVLEQDATFDIVADEDRYLYPEDMVQLRRLRFSSTPSDDTTYRDLPELFSDETRSMEYYGKSEGDPCNYWARAQFLQLVPRPDVAVADGGLISYWKLASRVTTADIANSAVLEVPEYLRVLVRERMLVFAKVRLERYDEANSDLLAWTREVEGSLEKIEDRSSDRRSGIRLEATRASYGRMN